MFGTFTTAKERVVAAGRALSSAAGSTAGVDVLVAESDFNQQANPGVEVDKGNEEEGEHDYGGKEQDLQGGEEEDSVRRVRRRLHLAEATGGRLQSDLEATTDEDCPKVQARRREAVRNRLLGLDLLEQKDDCRSSDDYDDENTNSSDDNDD